MPVTITGSHLISETDNAMYMAGAAQVTIENSEIKETSAIYQKSGKLTIKGEGTQIIGTSEPKTYTHSGNGSDPTGDALVVETCNYPGGAPELDIQGGTFTTKAGTETKAVIVYRWEKAPEEQKDPSAFISGGTFSTDVTTYLAAGKVCTQDSNGTWTVGAAEGPIVGTVTEDTLSVDDTKVKDAVTGQLNNSTAAEVKIEVQAPSEGTNASTVQVPLNADALGALENVTKPVVIDTPQGSVSVDAKTLVTKTGNSDTVTFKMENTTKSGNDTVETYTVGFYKTTNGVETEVEVKDLTTQKITLTFKTGFKKNDNVIVTSGDTVINATVGDDGLVTVTSTHLSDWTIKRAPETLTAAYGTSLIGGKVSLSGLTANNTYICQISRTKTTITYEGHNIEAANGPDTVAVMFTATEATKDIMLLDNPSGVYYVSVWSTTEANPGSLDDFTISNLNLTEISKANG